MKKTIILVLILALCFPILSNANSDISVVLNGQPISFDVKPLIQDSRTLVPIRFISENMGAKVEWDQELQEVTITKDSKIIKLIIGEKTATINGEVIEFDTKAILYKSRTLVPIRFISESLDAVVDWDNDTRTVIIKTDQDSADNKIIIDGKEIESNVAEVPKTYNEVISRMSEVEGNIKVFKKDNNDYINLYYAKEGEPNLGISLPLSNLDYTIIFYLYKDEYDTQYLLSIKKYDEVTLNAVKESLKVFYPTKYKQAFEEVVKYTNKKEISTSKTYYYDGRKFATSKTLNGTTSIYIGGVK